MQGNFEPEIHKTIRNYYIYLVYKKFLLWSIMSVIYIMHSHHLKVFFKQKFFKRGRTMRREL